MDNVGFIFLSTRTITFSFIIIIVLSLKGIIENTCRLAKDSFYQVYFHAGLARQFSSVHVRVWVLYNMKTNLVTIEINLGYVFQFKLNLRIIQNIEGSHIREVDLQLDHHVF